MPTFFTTSASSRFVDRDAVVERLTELARSLRKECREVRSVLLFGSFAEGTATPHSDADVVVEVGQLSTEAHQRLEDRASRHFLQAPVPVDLFVLDGPRLEEKRGVAGAVRRGGVRLA